MKTPAKPCPPLGNAGSVTKRAQDIPALDGLRGCAALIVFLSHYSNATGLWGKLLGDGGGQIGVMVFFALSGFLMGHLYLDRPFTSEAAKRYLIRRAARVLPLFYLAILVSTAAAAAFGADFALYRIDDVWRLLLLVRGSDVLWTIPVECQFYVLFLVIWRCHAAWRGATLLGLAVAAVASLSITDVALAETVVTCFPYFAIGILISRLPARRESHALPLALNVASLSIFPLLALTFPQVSAVLFGSGWPLSHLGFHAIWQSPVRILAAGGILIAAVRLPWIGRPLSTPAMRELGRISYAVYLLHVPVLRMLVGQTTALRWPAAFALVAAAVVILVAAAVNRVYEAPMRQAIAGWLVPAAKPSAA